MSAKLLNIEIGRRIVKVCVTEKKGKGLQISDSFTFSTPDGAVVEGNITDPQLLGEELAAQLKKNMLQSINRAVFSVASPKIASREIKMPLTKPEQVKNIVATNASEYFPIDVSDYEISSTILDDDGKEFRILVVAVPGLIVGNYIALADAAGLTIDALDYAGNSEYQVLRDISGDGVDMCVTVDSDSACVTFMENGKMLLQRYLSVGGDEIITEYENCNIISEGGYREILEKLSVSSADDKPAVDMSALTGSLQYVVNSIARSRDFFASGANSDKTVNRVILMGSCAHIAGMKEEIAAATGFDTLWIEEIDEMQALANSVKGLSEFIGCVGARIEPMSLLPASYKKNKGNAQTDFLKSNLGGVIGVLCVVLALLLCVPALIENISKTKELEKVNEEISQLQPAEETYKTYLSYTAGEENLKTFVNTSETPNRELLAFIEEMEEKMPSEIVVLTASCTNESVTLSVTVPDYDSAAVVVRQFRSFKSIDVINVTSFAKSGDDTGIESVSFSISCLYPVPEEETEPVTVEETTEEEE